MDQREGGEFQAFPSNCLCLTVSKNLKFRRRTLQCFTNFGYRKIYASKRYVTVFCRFVFV